MEKTSAYVAYEEAQKQMEEIQERVKKMRVELLTDVLTTIKQQIKEFDIKPSQLFSSAVLNAQSDSYKNSEKEESPPKPPKEPAPVKYKGANGETWSGGRGRKPAWVKTIEEAGGNIEDYKI